MARYSWLRYEVEKKTDGCGHDPAHTDELQAKMCAMRRVQ